MDSKHIWEAKGLDDYISAIKAGAVNQDYYFEVIPQNINFLKRKTYLIEYK